jgi:hypothetical protein
MFANALVSAVRSRLRLLRARSATSRNCSHELEKIARFLKAARRSFG